MSLTNIRGKEYARQREQLQRLRRVSGAGRGRRSVIGDRPERRGRASRKVVEIMSSCNNSVVGQPAASHLLGPESALAQDAWVKNTNMKV